MAAKRKKTALRWIFVTFLGLVLLASIATAILRYRFNGPALAETIELILNSDIRGRVEIESVEWPLSSLSKMITGGWIPIEIYGLKVYDDGAMQGAAVAKEQRELLLDINYVTAYIDAHSLILGHHDFVIKDLRVPNGGYVLLREVEEPYPLHLYDTSIVSLASAFYSRLELGFRAGISAASAKIFDIRSFDIQGATLEIIYPGAHLILEDVHTQGFVRSDYSDPLKLKVYYALAPRAQRGVMCVGMIESDRTLEKPYLSIDDANTSGTLCASTTLDGEDRVVYPIPLEDIHIDRLAQLPNNWPRDSIAHDVEWRMNAKTPKGAVLALDGMLKDYWLGYYGGDYDISLAVANAGSLMDLITNELTGGDNVVLKAHVTGPSIRPKVALDIENLDIRLLDSNPDIPLNLHLKRARAAFDMATEEGSLEDTIAQGAGGQVELSAFFGLLPFKFNLEANIQKPLDVRPYIPPDVVALLGEGRAGFGRLGGRLAVTGDALIQEVSPLELFIGDTRISGKLFSSDSQFVHAENLAVRLGETTLTTNGSMDIIEGDFNLNVDLLSEDLPTRLKALGLPNLAKRANGRARLRGTMEKPRAHAELDLGGVQVIRGLHVDLDYSNDEVVLNEASSSGLDGRILAKGRVRIAPSIDVLEFDAKADRLDLSRIPMLSDTISGRFTGTAKAKGRVDRLDATAVGTFEDLNIAGDDYTFDKPIALRSKPDGRKQVSFALRREGGGSLSTDASIDAAGNLSGEVALNALPLQELGILGGVEKSPVGGLVSTSLTLGGTLDGPTVDGSFKWFRGWFDRAFLGAGAFLLTPNGTGRVRATGSLLQGDVDIDADVSTAAPYDARFTVQLRRVELDRFAPELAESMNIRGWISGTIVAQIPLVPAPGRAIDVTAHLSEAEIWIDNEDANGRPTPVQVRNRLDTPIALHYDGTNIELTQPVTLVGPGGAEFRLAGGVRDDKLDMTLKGDIDLGLLQPYVREYVASVRGTLGVDVAVQGTLDAPRVAAVIEVGDNNSDVIVESTRQDAVISIVRGGVIRMTNDYLSPTGLFVIVEDPYTGEKSRLSIKGGIGLIDFKPDQLALQIDGQLAGRLLTVVAPEIFSRASGNAEVDLALSGTLDDPRPIAEIYFERETPFSMTPRGLRRELRFLSGEISLDPDRLLISDLNASVDDEGTLRDINGTVELDAWQPIYVDLTASADTISYRLPGNLDLTLNVNDLTIRSEQDATDASIDDGTIVSDFLTGDEEALAFASGIDGLVVSGKIEVVDGRYIRDFNLITQVLTPAASDDESSSGQAFYDEVPLIGDARLDLTIETRGFFVQNNLADIQLIGGLAITGLVRDPKFDGEIRVSQGEFKLPGIRAKFTRTHGSVSFSQFKDFPGDTPTLNLTSESEYREPNGQEHLVTLTLNGTLSALNWDLYTSSGLNKGQTVTMLLSGRTPEEFRKSLGDEALGRDPSRIDPSTAPTENAADQFIKDLAGDFISLLIEDKLRNLTTLDVARLEIGTGSIGFHAEKELLKNLRLFGDLEQTLRGRTYDFRGELKITDKWSLEGEQLTKQYDDDSQEDIQETRLRTVFRWFW